MKYCVYSIWLTLLCQVSEYSELLEVQLIIKHSLKKKLINWSMTGFILELMSKSPRMDHWGSKVTWNVLYCAKGWFFFKSPLFQLSPGAHVKTKLFKKTRSISSANKQTYFLWWYLYIISTIHRCSCSCLENQDNNKTKLH